MYSQYSWLVVISFSSVQCDCSFGDGVVSCEAVVKSLFRLRAADPCGGSVRSAFKVLK